MNELLARIIESHRGIDCWNRYEKVEATIVDVLRSNYWFGARAVCVLLARARRAIFASASLS
jgi:hypothetical protein